MSSISFTTEDGLHSPFPEFQGADSSSWYLGKEGLQDQGENPEQPWGKVLVPHHTPQNL